LFFNFASDAGSQAEGGQVFAHIVLTHTALQQLDLASNRIGDDAGRPICEALASNTTLTSLSLRDNLLATSSGAALLTAMEDNNTLLKLDLEMNRLRHDAMRRTLDAVAENAKRWREAEPSRMQTDVRPLSTAWCEQLSHPEPDSIVGGR
jgi:Ran GTPase-activating protein (RanGAP) involved in mRNA processing and transport